MGLFETIIVITIVFSLQIQQEDAKVVNALLTFDYLIKVSATTSSSKVDVVKLSHGPIQSLIASLLGIQYTVFQRTPLASISNSSKFNFATSTERRKSGCKSNLDQLLSAKRSSSSQQRRLAGSASAGISNAGECKVRIIIK